MKLFELRPRKDLKADDDPWVPWYDKCFGFIIRAESEIEARKMADDYENCGTNIKTPWLDKKYSTCVELTGEGEVGIIMDDYRKA